MTTCAFRHVQLTLPALRAQVHARSWMYQSELGPSSEGEEDDDDEEEEEEEEDDESFPAIDNNAVLQTKFPNTIWKQVFTESVIGLSTNMHWITSAC